MWVGVKVETVGWLPEGIDDLKVYDIKNYCNSDALRDDRARKLDTDSVAKFMTLCDNLLFSATEAAYYESTKAEINESYCSKVRVGIFVILGLVVARKTRFLFFAHLHHQMRWEWIKQNSFTLGGFIGTGLIYRLLDVWLADTRDSLFSDNELKDCQSVAALGGKGPSYADQKKK